MQEIHTVSPTIQRVVLLCSAVLALCLPLSAWALTPDQAVRIAAGAGYLLALTGDIVTMPGLPHDPAAHRIDLSNDGEIIGV